MNNQINNSQHPLGEAQKAGKELEVVLKLK